MKPILISGAGLGGLLLARCLHRRAVPFELYERDAHAAARGQGYRIRISADDLDALTSVFGGWRSSTTQEFEREMRVYASENVRMSFEEASGRFNITALK